MVDIRAERNERTRAKGHQHRNLVSACVCFNAELFDQILAEATSRGWTLSHMVRFLCEASIDGVE